MSILEVNHIKKVYKTRMGGEAVTALRDVHFSVEPGDFVAIMGESGSGKTTLINILASLDTPTAGKVLVDGKDFTTLKDNERAIFRRSNLGFIFQDFNLLDNFSNEIHYETELVVRINRLGKNIAPRFANRYYDAVTVGIDFTARDLKRKFREQGNPWELCKGFDSSAAIGTFVPVDRYKDIQNLNFNLLIDGKEVQSGCAAD